MKPMILLVLAIAVASAGCDQSAQLRSELEDLREARQKEAQEAQDLEKEIGELKAELAKSQLQLTKSARGASQDVQEKKKELRAELTAAEKRLNKDQAAVEEAKQSLE